MGSWTNDIEDFCPICDCETQQIASNDNDDTGTHVVCCECETELPLPKVHIDEPFLIGDMVYIIHQGSDDEWSLQEYQTE